jgi:hypothetical protein
MEKPTDRAASLRFANDGQNSWIRYSLTGHSALGSNLRVELLSAAGEKGDTRDFIEYAFTAF